MKISDFAKIHNRSAKEINFLLKMHLEEINADGEHAKLVNSEWLIDDFAADYLELLFTDGMKKENYNSENSLDDLTGKIADLQNALKKAEETIKTKDDEFAALQERIIGYENGANTINSDLIRKHKLKAERLEKELEQANFDMIKLRKLKDERISKQESAIHELQDKIAELNTIIKKKMDSDMENLQKSISEDKLKGEIHSLELKLADAEREKEQMRIAFEDSENKNSDLKNLISVSLTNLSRVQNSLRTSIETKLPEQAETSVIQNIQSDNADNLDKIDKNLQELRSLKQEGYSLNEQSSPGFFRSVLAKAASFF